MKNIYRKENNNRMENNFSCRLDLMAIKQSYNNLMQSSREGLKIFHVSVYFVEIKEIIDGQSCVKHY